jgi:hypothetical protein
MNTSQMERIWIFASEKVISESLGNEIVSEIKLFLSQWKAHGKPLASNVEILGNHFIKIAVDESFENASGCSIDTMVKFIQSIESEFSINLTDRSLVYFRNDKNEIFSDKFQNVKNLIRSGKINEKTLVYNTAVNNSSEFGNSWISVAKDTWLKKYFQNIHV